GTGMLDAHRGEPRRPLVEVAASGDGEGEVVETGPAWIELARRAGVLDERNAVARTGEAHDGCPAMLALFGEHGLEAEHASVPGRGCLHVSHRQRDVMDRGKGRRVDDRILQVRHGSDSVVRTERRADDLRAVR